MDKPISAEYAVEVSATPVFNYLRRYCGDADLAQDLTQDTLLRIAESIGTFNRQSSLETWAFTIATRVAADHFRRLRRSVHPAPWDGDDEIVDAGADVEKRLVVDEMNACVRSVIDRLPEDYRVALVLRDLEGLGVADVAKISGCSVATAKIRIHRARRRLRAALGNACEFYTDSDDVFRCDRK